MSPLCIHHIKPIHCWCTTRSRSFGLVNGQAVEYAIAEVKGKKKETRTFIPHKSLPLSQVSYQRRSHGSGAARRMVRAERKKKHNV